MVLGGVAVIKRPMLGLLTAYILGVMCSGWPLFLVILCVLLYCVLVKGIPYFVTCKKLDFILWVVPIFFFLGYVLTLVAFSDGPLNSYLSDGDRKGSILGTIDSIQPTKSSNKLIITDAVYTDQERTESLGKCVVYNSDVSDLHIGNRVKFTGKLSLCALPTNPGQYNERLYYKTIGIDCKMMASSTEKVGDNIVVWKDLLYQLRTRVRAIYTSLLDERTAGIIQAMILGEMGALDNETKNLFGIGGISHILSISGLHITLLGTVVYGIMSRMGGIKAAVLVTILFIFFYGVFTNFSVSTNRAIVMMILLLLGKCIGRTYDVVTALSISGLFILLRQPLQIYQSGFLLSFGAVLGVAIVYPILLRCFEEEETEDGEKEGEKKREKKREKKGELEKKKSDPKMLPIKERLLLAIGKSLLFNLAIQLVTIPILLTSFYELATYGAIVNLLALPAMSIVVILPILGGVVGFVCLPLAKLILFGAKLILTYYQLLCQLVAKLPGAVLVLGEMTTDQMLLYYMLGVVALLLLLRRKKSGFLVILGMCLLIFWPGDSSYLTITMLDIGQGQCMVVQTPSKNTYLVDAGSSDVSQVGRYRVLPYLSNQGITKIDYVLVSHGDSDHISAVYELLEAHATGELQIGSVVLPLTTFQDEALEELTISTRNAGVDLNYIEENGQIVDGKVTFSCLFPNSKDTYSSANGYSMVLSIEYGEFSMLCTGDLEMEGEERLLQKQVLQSYDVLQVGHHGSRYSSSPEFLQVTTPKVAVISAGRKNSYGHPHLETLERLEDVGAKVYSTTEKGAIFIRTNGWEYEVSSYIGD